MATSRRTRVELDRLEPREQPSVTAAVSAGMLTISGDAANNWIDVYRDGTDLVVSNKGETVGRFASASVFSLVINGNGGDDVLRVESDVAQPATLTGGSDRSKLKAGGGGATLQGGPNRDVLVGGAGQDSFNGGAGENLIERLQPTDPYTANPGDRVALDALLPNPNVPGAPQQVILTNDPQGVNEVEAMLSRAAAASASHDGIIAVVDRNGRILGIRVESGVSPSITGNPALLAFAIDGAVAEARTGAFFGNDQAPLTSRTVGFISQSTITEREVKSNPNITDPNSTDRGPGFVANVGVAGHFPPGIALTPQVDLFGIEHTNRDSTYAPGPDGILGTADDIPLPARFDIDPTYVPPGQTLFPPDSYGFESGVAPRTANGKPIAVSRGIGTLPGGIPIYKYGQVVGGIGVFFPGTTGYATEENSSRSSTYDPTKPDRTLEAEFMALAAVGGVQGILPVGTIGGVTLPAGFGIPNLPPNRIDLVGIQLDVFGPGGLDSGVNFIRNELTANVFGAGDPNDGKFRNLPVSAGPDGIPFTADDVITRNGLPAPDGWLVVPHDGVGVTAADVLQIITDGIAQANDTRAAIRLGLGERTKMVFAVTDKTGAVLGLYRMPDATVFSIDVAVAKARNVAYFADPTKLQPQDQVPGVPAGAALTNRTFRYLAEPRFPEGIDGAPPGPFSQLNDGGADPFTGLQVGPRLPASAYQSVFGHDAFNPGTNFHETSSANQNGIVFFPGSSPLYKGGALVGGLGVSGDGVDQDDVVTGAAQQFYQPSPFLQADQFTFNGVHLPYQKTNRNPEG